MNRRRVALIIAVIVAVLLLIIQGYRYWGGAAADGRSTQGRIETGGKPYV